mgnify:CR=1 FL=1
MLVYALAAGLTLAGLAGSAIEMAAGRRLCFRPPFVTRRRFGLSLLLTMATGPFMLANEALAARRCGAIDRAPFGLCILVAAIWSIATGILMVELALMASALLV